MIYPQAGCDLNIQDKGGWTALWHAVSDANENIVRCLVTAGADATVTDQDGCTVIEEAKQNELDEVLDILMKAKH